mgnify:CR=1 FL=1
MTFATLLLVAFAGLTPNTDVDRERFLLKAKVMETRPAPGGTTKSRRATLSDGAFSHDAHIQQIRREKAREFNLAAISRNFIDSWSGNVAAYRLDRLLGLNMTPVSVGRRVAGVTGAVTWWVDDVLMPVSNLSKSGLKPPNPEDWQRRNDMMRLFGALISNPDRNSNNMLITTEWELMLIDHTRAFRWNEELEHPQRVRRCDRQVFAALKALNRKQVNRSLAGLLAGFQIDALLVRRDAIVTRLEQLIEIHGEDEILFDRLSPAPAVAGVLPLN